MKLKLSLKQLILGLLGAVILPFTVNAQDVSNWYYEGIGGWGTAGNWLPSGVPPNGSGTEVRIGSIYSGTASITSGGYSVGSVYLGYVGGKVGGLSVSGGLLNTGTLWAGLNSTGNLAVSGNGVVTGDKAYFGGQVAATATITDNGRVEFNDYVGLGEGSINADGSSLRISGSAVLKTSLLRIGNNGQGTLYLDGGTVQASSIILGNNYGVLQIGGDGSGKLLDAGSGAPAIIHGGPGTGIVRFAYSGNIVFDNKIEKGESSYSNVEIEHVSGTTTLTNNSDLKKLSVTGGILNIDLNKIVSMENGVGVVGNGATLGGLGLVISLMMTVESGGHLDTTLHLEGDLRLNSGAVLDYYNNAYLLVGIGTLTVGDDVLVNFSNATLEMGEEYSIIGWAGISGSLTADQFSATGLDDGIKGTFSVANDQLIFTTTAVPEPSTYFLLGTGLGVIGLLKLRRQRQQG
jgi:hypothetical protein